MKKIHGKDLLLNIIENSSNILDNLIEVHKVIFTQKLGQRLDYENLIAAARQGREVFTAMDELTKKKSRFEGVEALDLSLVTVYVFSLLQYANALAIILTNLEEKANGGKYGFFAYKKDLKKYNESMDAYMSVAELVSVVYVKYKN